MSVDSPPSAPVCSVPVNRYKTVYVLCPFPQDISSGFVLCDTDSLCHVGSTFDAQIVILEHKSIICAGYSAVLHIHSVVEEVQIKVGVMGMM